ncbi:MAG: lytic transglycosylase domain-containing protein [Eikenella sp.]|nr:lytic transglycosylase domain-containing protein [Eikenella sp.]
MPIPHRLRLLALTAALAACSSQVETPVEPVKPGQGGQVQLPGSRSAEADAKVLADYQAFLAAQEALKQNDDAPAARFLAHAPASAMSNTLRNQWLKLLGRQSNWTAFAEQYGRLKADARDQETRCYAAMAGLEAPGEWINELMRELGRLPEGCNRLLNALAAEGLDRAAAWRRVRGLLAANQITDARNLAAALGSPLPNPLTGGNSSSQGGQEALLHSVIGQNARREAGAANRLRSLSGSLRPEQTGFAWAVLGHQQALNQNFAQALQFFQQADRSQLSKEHWEWYARSALRLGRWSELKNIIQAMPAKLQADPAWQYWLGRSLAAEGQQAAAQNLYRQAAASGRNFYALLATEALGGKVDARNNTGHASAAEVSRVAADGAIARALSLFRASQSSGDWAMRRQAQAEWRYAIAGFNEPTLLAAAKLAHDQGFYEMGILAADKTDRLLDYGLRYITPFRDITTRYAAQANVDPAWVYGLIRQESRFMIGVRSRVGATGLMQVMPATAREIANKIGMNPADLHSIEGNIRMGTWYLGDARNRLGHEVLATAGYNAGPGRARRWQASVPLEGAVYAETIPFDETRDYVKRVMANATYYAALFNEPHTSLTRRMGTIPAR